VCFPAPSAVQIGATSQCRAAVSSGTISDRLLTVRACDDPHSSEHRLPSIAGCARNGALLTIWAVSSTRPAFKQTQVFTWDSESADDRPVEFASSAFGPAKRSSEFASSSFMDAAPDRPARRRKRRLVPLFWLATIAMLCLLSGVVALALLA